MWESEPAVAASEQVQQNNVQTNKTDWEKNHKKTESQTKKEAK